MKSDVIRKRARQEARKGSSTSGTPSASPGNSARASPVAGGASSDHHPSSHSLSHPYDFSASAFEFAAVAHDTTDRLTHQHDTHDANGGFNSALSPGTTSYLETLNLQYPASSHGAGVPDQPRDFHPFDGSSGFEQAFQDDGSKRRRVSPDSDLGQLPSSSSGSVASSFLSGHSSSEQTDATSFTSHSPIFDSFTSYFPYTFNFAPTASGWAPPTMSTYNLTEEDSNDMLAGGPAHHYGPMDHSAPF